MTKALAFINDKRVRDVFYQAALLIGLSDGLVSVFLPVFSSAFTPTLSKIIATLLVALVLVFRPQGLFGRAER